MSSPAHAPAAIAHFAVDGMTCQNCARHVRESSVCVPAVADAHVELAANRLTIHWRNPENSERKTQNPKPESSSPKHETPNPEPETQNSLDAVLEAVRAAGYPIRALPPEAPAHVADATSWSPFQGWRFNVVVGSLATDRKSTRLNSSHG